MKLFTLPNLITLGNAYCGCMAIVQIMLPEPKLIAASIFVLLAALLDFLDGLVARILKQASPIGKQLDSLADVISFGLVPALIARELLIQHEVFAVAIWANLGFLIALFSALRLAKFNVDERQSDGFIGLPTPANTLIWIGFPLAELGQRPDWMSSLLLKGWPIVLLILLSSVLLVVEIRLLSLKFKNLSWDDNKGRWILILLSILCLVFFHFAALPIIVLLYLVLSLIFITPRTHEI